MAIYSDIDQDFMLNSEGDVDVLEDLDAIKQSIKNIILTPSGQRTRYQDPEYGCGVFTLLFEKMNSVTELLLQEEIESALGNFEPRVELIEVEVTGNPTNNSYEILIKYKVLSINIVDDVVIDLEVLK